MYVVSSIINFFTLNLFFKKIKLKFKEAFTFLYFLDFFADLYICTCVEPTEN